MLIKNFERILNMWRKSSTSGAGNVTCYMSNAAGSVPIYEYTILYSF